MNMTIENVTDRVADKKTIILDEGLDKWETVIELHRLDNGDVYLPVRPILNSLNLKMSGQRRRILSRKNRYNPVLITADAGHGEPGEELYISRDQLPKFLESVDQKQIADYTALDSYMEFFDENESAVMEGYDYHLDSSNYLLHGIDRERKIVGIDCIEFGFLLSNGRAAENLNELLMAGHVRITVERIGGRIWYVGKDVCTFLHMTKYRTILGRVSEENKRYLPIHTAGGQQTMTCLNIDGIAEIGKNSRKRKVKRFLRKYLDI